MFNNIIKVTDFLWGTPLTIFVIAIGIYLSYCCGFIQLTKIKMIFKNTTKKILKKNRMNEEEKRTISTVLAGTIGTGNIAGIASAIAVGGPGAIFWMWIISFISMTTKMAEVMLAVKYREKRKDGTYVGGPMYYIKRINGKVGKFLAMIYSIALLTYVITDSCFAQMNTLASTINETFNIPLILIGIVAIVISVIIINKGFNMTSSILKKLVPIMTIIYLSAVLIVIAIYIKNIPNAFYMIIKYAFSPAPVIGGFTGATIMTAISKGAARGIFANEAGLGTSSTIYSTNPNSTPLKQGFWGIMEVALVSFGTCTLTALLIMCTGVLETGDTGSILVLNSFEVVYGNFGKVILCIIITLFAYSTYIGFFTEFKTSIEYLFGEKSFKYLKWFYYIPVIFAVLLPIDAIWALADMSVGFIIIPNLISLVYFGEEIKKLVKSEIRTIQ